MHVFSPDAPEHGRHIVFRDRLRTNSGDRLLYESAKRDLAARPWEDTTAYAEAKSEVVERILSEVKNDSEAGKS